MTTTTQTKTQIGCTPQGRAIQKVCHQFGDGCTLPFAPCKKGYEPIQKQTKQRMYACYLHDKHRKKRIQKEGGKYRLGEVSLEPFWEYWEQQQQQQQKLQQVSGSPSDNEEEDKDKSSPSSKKVQQ